MMEFKHIFLFSGLLSLLVSCNKEITESNGLSVVNPNPPERRVEFLSFKASLENKYLLKTALDLSITHKVIWERNDEVLIEDAEGKSAIYQALSGGRDTTTLVRVSGDTLTIGSTYKAWYPVSYREEGMPSTLYYDDASTLREGPMYAEGMGKLDFSSVCAAVRFSYNPPVKSIVKKIVFSADESLSPKDSVVMDITTNYPNGRTLYPTTRNEFSLFMLPGIYNNLKAKFYNGKEVLADVTLEYQLDIAKGTIFDVDLNNPEGRVVNLSKLGTANCYPITHAGDYLFTPTRGCDKTPIEGIESVEILWETDNSTTEILSSSISNLKYEGGKITFSVAEDYKPSNILLAAKNAGGDILWSWHIWINEGSIGNQQFGTEANPMFLMDRSLGTLAAYASKATGAKYAVMLYQWGRKDPFPGSTVNSTSGLRPYSELHGIDRTSEAGPVSQEVAAAHPYVFYKHATDWCSEPVDTLWAADHKTVYDPCPVGYRIPPMAAFSNQEGEFYKGWAAGNLSNSGGIYGGKNSLNQMFYGFPLTNFFPGHTAEMTSGSSSRHIAWTTDKSGDGPLAAQLVWADKKVTLQTNVAYKKSDALSVRCMLIQE